MLKYSTDDMEKGKEIDMRRFFNLDILVYSVTLIFLICIAVVFPFHNFEFNNEKAINYNQGWVNETNQGHDVIDLPEKVAAQKNETFIISKNLPTYLHANTTILVRSSQQFIRILIDDEEIYKTEKLNNTLGNFAHSAWNLARLPQNAQGKKITIEFISPYTNFSGVINPILIGSKASLLYYVAQNHAPNFIFVIVMMIISIFQFFIHLISLKHFKDNNNLLHLSVFSFLVSMWMFSESRYTQFFFGNQYLISIAASTLIMIIPIPIIRYMSNICKNSKRLIQGAYLILVTNLFLILTLQLTQKLDLFESLSITHVSISVVVILSLIVLLRELIIYHNKEVWVFLQAFSVLAIFMIIELINFYVTHFSNVSLFFGLGMLLFILIMSLYSLRKLDEFVKLKQDKEYYERLSFFDYLTQTLNRRAYMSEVQRIYQERKIYQNFSVCVFDVNDMKVINDNYGHLSGDEALINCSQCIEETFGHYGLVYRIGGDEFVCLIENANLKTLMQCEKDLLEIIENRNRILEYKLGISIGFSSYQRSDTSFDDIFDRADKMMYRNKNMERLKQ